MRNKLPVILAIAAATQWAPLMTGIINADDSSEKSSDDTENISSQLQSHETDNQSFQEASESVPEYLNNDVNLLIIPTVPSATIRTLSKREKVYVLDEENGYAEISDHGITGWVIKSSLSDSLSKIFDDVNQTMYVSADHVNVYSQPDTGSSVMTSLSQNDEVTVTGTSTESMDRVSVNGQTGYIDSSSLTDHVLTFAEQLSSIQTQPVTYSWTGAVLNTSTGSVNGPSGKETYYNLDMSGVISVMRSLGFDENNYPCWVRSDGAKMLGPYVMVAADLNQYPKGSIIEISLGKAIVCDTGAFTSNGSGTSVDVAVTW